MGTAFNTDYLGCQRVFSNKAVPIFSDSLLTLTDMRRKGSWASRRFGRKNLPPLVDKKGKPTRMALQARAWGEPVPRTPQAARRIAAKGKRLLKRYKYLKSRETKN